MTFRREVNPVDHSIIVHKTEKPFYLNADRHCDDESRTDEKIWETRSGLTQDEAKTYRSTATKPTLRVGFVVSGLFFSL